MKKVFYITGTIIIIIAVGLGGWWSGKNKIFEQENPVRETKNVIEKPLEKYEITKLISANDKRKITGNFESIKPLEKTDTFTKNVFQFKFDPTFQGGPLKTVSGQIYIPGGKGKFPVILMLRGYVDQEIYQTGVGTSHAAEVFAKNGYLTVAPDFLGYGNSDAEADNIFESRFQTYTTAISIMQSLSGIDKWDGKNIFIWGHSNGGQIALTLLEATGVDYPTTLWAPVSKPFPYSILYYTDESTDGGKLIRSELAKFEDRYNTDLFSIHMYYDRIKAPIQLHQGTADDAVPENWSDTLTKTLKNLEKPVDYYVYPGTNHNMVPSWNTVVARDLQFFQKYMHN